jgi:Rieske Fe-S protein
VDPGTDTRRGFFAKLIAVVVGAGVYAAPIAIGMVAFLNPLRASRRQTGGEGFIRLASLDTLPADGTPRKVPVVMDRVDAWNRFVNEPVGAVYLRRAGEKTVEAIQVVCPHAGCYVDFDGEKREFYCPCHNGHFDLVGKRLDENSPSPRDLDTLDVEVRGEDEVWVRFQTFRTGTAEKIAEA